MSTGKEGEERIPDELEVHGRTWRAQEGLAGEGTQIVEQLGLDPEHAERLHFAAVESGDHDLTMQRAPPRSRRG